MEFFEKVKHVRAKLLITQRELAKQLDVSTATVNRWESVRLEPTFLNEKRFDKFSKEHNIDFKEEL